MLIPHGRNLFRVYLIGIHWLLARILWKSNFPQKLGYRFGVITPGEHSERMLSCHQWMDLIVPAGSVVFIGDSITQGLPVSAIVANGINYGIGGDTTVGVLRRLSQIRVSRTPARWCT